MSKAPSRVRVLLYDYWTFSVSLLLVLPPVCFALGFFLQGREGATPVLIFSLVAAAFVLWRLHRILNLLLNGETVQGSVLMALQSSYVFHLRVSYSWGSHTYSKKWLLSGLAGKPPSRIQIHIDPDRPGRAYPLWPFIMG